MCVCTKVDSYEYNEYINIKQVLYNGIKSCMTKERFLIFKIDARKYSRKQKRFNSIMLMLKKQQQRARQWEA